MAHVFIVPYLELDKLNPGRSDATKENLFKGSSPARMEVDSGLYVRMWFKVLSRPCAKLSLAAWVPGTHCC